jgi:hypothetical protein
LKSFLKQRLPEYMVPDIFVLIDQLPLTPNGKINRRALPAPSSTRTDSSFRYVAPRTPVEQVLASIWAEVLGVDLVGAYDNFFDLGGHSLLATQVISRVRQRLGYELTLRSLFEHARLADMASEIEKAGGEEGAGAGIERLQGEGLREVSYSQQRLWFMEQMGEGGSGYNMTAGVRIRGELKVEVLEESIREVVRRHEVLRSRYVNDEGVPKQEVEQEAEVEVREIELRGEMDREGRAREIGKREAGEAFDLTQAPLMRACLMQLDEQDYVLIFTMHHIISDAWSLAILVRETSMLYEAYSTGNPSPLAELPIQYADFAAWQRKRMDGKVLEEQLSYWTEQLSNAPTILELPTDRPRPVIQTYRGARETLALSEELSAGLKALSRSEGVTLFMTLLAGFQTLLHLYTRQDDILVGTNIANRNRAELEGLIGFFVNNLVLRADFSDCSSFRDLLKQVREVALGAYAHQELPFERLVEELQPERTLSYNPLFQVMFVLQNAPEETVTLPGLTLTPFDLSNDAAVFDLLLNMQETEKGLAGALQYNTDLFDSARIERMLSHFQIVLQAMVEDPGQDIKTISLTTQEESRELIYAFNGD